MSEIYNINQSNKRAILAYSLPGSKEFTLATIKQVESIDAARLITDFDYIIAPFDKKKHDKLGVTIASYATSKKFDCAPFGYLLSSGLSFENYKTVFDKAHSLISNGELDKIVISRVKNVKEEVGDLYPLFISLKNQYISAYTFLIHIPEWGTWMGSTPELLIRKENEQYLSRAVAGTRQSDNTASGWGQKEIEEHRYIESYLKEALTEEQIYHQISPSFTLEAGPVSHICSNITMRLNGKNLDQILDIIHPGPALSGMPRDKSVEYISAIESYDRKYYCGYIGNVVSKDNLALFATIRCMEVFRDGYKIYVGGGITRDSELDSEWKETELKAQTLISLLGKAKILN